MTQRIIYAMQDGADIYVYRKSDYTDLDESKCRTYPGTWGQVDMNDSKTWDYPRRWFKELCSNRTLIYWSGSTQPVRGGF